MRLAIATIKKVGHVLVDTRAGVVLVNKNGRIKLLRTRTGARGTRSLIERGLRKGYVTAEKSTHS